MHILALIILISVAAFGGFILLKRKQKQPIKRWMTLGHGAGAIIGLVALLMGIVELYSTDALNQWVLIASGLIASVVIGGFLLFEKWLKGKRKPFVVLFMHGAFAVSSVGVLAYSYLI